MKRVRKFEAAEVLEEPKFHRGLFHCTAFAKVSLCRASLS